MEKLCIYNIQLVDPESIKTFVGAIFIENGMISDVSAGLDKADNLSEGIRKIDGNGAFLAPGIVDIGVKIGEPGERHHESFHSAAKAAAAGGVTTIVARPDTRPPIDTPEILEFVTRRSAEASMARICHMAALTKGIQGQEMTEIGFLMDAGVVAFTDAFNVITNTKILTRALTYAKSLGALVMGHPQEPNLSKDAVASAGKFAMLRGLPTVHSMAERIGLDRDIGLVEMTGARYHIDQITTARSSLALERAIDNGLPITAGTSIHHFTLNDLDIGDYRTFFKLIPPLRSEEDRLATVEALSRGVIQIIGSFHTPADEESKRLPFQDAASGAVGLQTLLPAALRLYHEGHMSLPQLFRSLSLNPAKLLNMPQGRLKKGAPADLILFDPDQPFILNRLDLLSKSKNTPFDGARMQGKVLATYIGGKNVYQANSLR